MCVYIYIYVYLYWGYMGIMEKKNGSYDSGLYRV